MSICRQLDLEFLIPISFIKTKGLWITMVAQWGIVL